MIVRRYYRRLGLWIGSYSCFRQRRTSVSFYQQAVYLIRVCTTRALVTKILSGLLLSVTLSLFTLTQLSYFLSPGQVIVHVHCLWRTPNSRQELCGCRAGGLKLNIERGRTRGVGLLVLLLLFRTTFSHCYGHLSLGQGCLKCVES